MLIIIPVSILILHAPTQAVSPVLNITGGSVLQIVVWAKLTAYSWADESDEKSDEKNDENNLGESKGDRSDSVGESLDSLGE
jgi:hypothetical protein